MTIAKLHNNFNSYLGHGVRTIFGFQFGHADDISPVGGELSAEEEIDEINLSDDVDKVQHLADEESDGVKVVIVQIGGKVVDQKLFAFVFGLFGDDGAVEV